MPSPAELREQADALESEERERGIRERCLAGEYGWTRDGRCYREYHEFVSCPGHYGQKHFESYSDEYGYWVFCKGCRGSGRVFITHQLRVPQYDAPKPPTWD